MRALLTLCAFAVPLIFAASAVAAPAVGGPLPRLILGGEDEGLMTRDGDDDVRYGRFDSAKQLAPGKVYLVTYLAGRRGAQKMGQALKAEMQSRRPSAKFQPVNVMNLDDCVFGTCGFARGKFEDHLHAKPRVMHVVDEEGKGLKAWRAMEEGMAVYVVDHTGVITHMARGPFSAASAKAVAAAVDAAVAAAP